MSQRFGKYELLERIGSGGMAEVFRARLPGIAGFEKIVVIKRLHPHFASDEGVVQMFVDEAKLAAGVQHKNVVQVYELDRTDDGQLFIVMEWINGIDLKKLLRHAESAGIRIPPWFSVYVVCEALDALNHAYDLIDERGRRRNIVHRDVSPENIFISHHGDVKLGDFGVARDDTRPDPFAHEAKGKLGYMAPEQLAGERLDQRCDVFSAGVVLWECLTQQRLFRGESEAETMNLLLRGPRTAPSRMARDVPDSIDPILLWTLHIDRTKRTPTARAFQEQLLGVLHEMKPNASHVDLRAMLRALLETRSPDEEYTVAEVTDELIVSERSLAPVEHVIDLEPGSAIDDPALADVWDDGDSFPASEEVTLRPLPESALMFETVDERPATPGPVEPPDPSWDGTYAIINPRLKNTPGKQARRPPPSRKTSDLIETDDLVRRRLVYEVPIAAKPSHAETGDILKEQPHRDPITIESPSCWDDEHMPLTPTSASRVWAPYEGPHPFYLRFKSGEHLDRTQQEPFGPLSFTDLGTMIRSSIAQESKRSLEVSADGKNWMPLVRFLALAEHDVFGEAPPPNGTFSGTLGAPSLIGLLGEIAERNPTGKLTLIQSTGGRADIHISVGVPIHVTTDVAALETAELLVTCRVLERDAAIACMHDVLREERSLAAVVAQRTKIDLSERRPKLLLARLEALLDWTGARYVYTPAPVIGHALAGRSLYSLLFELVQRTRSPESIRGELLPLLGIRFERTARFERLFSQLDLPRNDLEGLGPFGFTRTLEEAIRTSTGGERFAWSAAYVLLELGFLKGRVRVS